MGLTCYIPFKPPASYLTLTLKSLGFSTFHTNLLAIPQYFAWIILVFGLTFLSRRLDQRALVSLIPQFWAIIFLTAIATIPQSDSAWIKYGLISALLSEWYVHYLLVAMPLYHPLTSYFCS